MRRLLLIICSIFCVMELSAQEPQTSDNQFTTMTLSDFNIIDVDAPIRLTLIRQDVGKSPVIEYNTHGNYTSKFTAEVDTRTKTLKISERSEFKRESITEVRVYFHTLSDISIAKADVTVEDTLNSQLLDIDISGDAHFKANIDVLDFKIYVSGKSRVSISGNTLYQSADITTAHYDALHLECVATIVSTSHNAVAKVDARERLEAKTSTGGSIYYKSEPVIFRSESTLFGGMISLL